MIPFQSIYQWIVKPQTVIKTNEMFLPGRMSFVFNMVRNLLEFVSTSDLLSSRCSHSNWLFKEAHKLIVRPTADQFYILL